MLLYLIALIGFFMTVIGFKYSSRSHSPIVLGREIEAGSILAVGAFILALVILLKFLRAG